MTTVTDLKTDARRYVRPIEVVQITGLSKSAVMAALWSGELEGYQKGRAWVIPVEAVDRWILGDRPSADHDRGITWAQIEERAR